LELRTLTGGAGAGAGGEGAESFPTRSKITQKKII